MKFRTMLFAGYGVVLAMLAVIAVIVYTSVTSLIDIQGWVDHTWNVINHGENIGAAMVDQETGIRGYMVTGEEDYLEPFTAGQATFAAQIAEVESLTSDNPAQVQRWREIEQMAEDWHENVVTRYMQMRQDANDGAEVVATFNQIQGRTIGKVIFDNLRQVLGDMDAQFAQAGNLAGQYLYMQILMDMVNQETGQRGFLLTGLDASLEPYHAGQEQLDVHLEELRQLIRSGNGSGVTLSQVSEAERLAERWVQEAALPEIEARRAVNNAKADMDDVAGLVSQGLGKQYMDGIRATLAEAIGAEQALIEQRSAEAERTANMTILITILGSLGAIIIGLSVAFVIVRNTTRQLGGEPAQMADMADEIYRGNLDIKFDDSGKSDTGIYLAFKKMVNAFRAKAAVIASFADGDLTADVALTTEQDELGKSMQRLKESLNEILSQARDAATQVTSGASQVSQSSQSLSSGAAEQASSLEEVSSSLSEINGQARQNAENASEANNIATAAAGSAEKGNEQMTGLLESMNKIGQSSDEIQKVTKVIDDIAFQINLLALNANVEAARAGKYGKGFAVVADEVRNLAVRSAEAVKETAAIVEESLKNSTEGLASAQQTAEQLAEISEGSKKVAEFLGEIALASNEQAQGVEQVNSGLDQIDQVTQANTASAEESASASEELSAQAQQLEGMIARFKLSGGAARPVAAATHPAVSRPARSADGPALPKPDSSGNGRKVGAAVAPSEVISLDDNDFAEF